MPQRSHTVAAPARRASRVAGIANAPPPAATTRRSWPLRASARWASRSRKKASPWLRKIAATDSPVSSSISASMSTSVQRRRSASLWPTVVLPLPMKPTSTTRRGGSATAAAPVAGDAALEEGVELREGDRRALRVLDVAVAVGRQRGHRERHRDAVVAVGPHARAAQGRATLDRQPVRALLDPRAHGPQPLGQRRDAVALLHPQLARARDTEDALRARGGHGERGHLVDQRGNRVRSHLDAFQRGRAGLDPAYRLRVLSPHAGLDVAAHLS